MMIRIALIDDQALLRVGFRMILEAEPDLTVVGEAGDGATGVALVAETRPDVALVDVRMPIMDGIEATQHIARGPSGTRVIILTTFDLDEYVFAGLRAGASGFLLKDAPPAELLSAVRTVAGGEAVLAPTATRRLIERFGPSVPQADRAGRRPDALADLTEREREVFGLIAGGLSNREIATRLYVSEGTVKVHVSRLLAKLDLRDRVQAVVLAYETGTVVPGDPGAG